MKKALVIGGGEIGRAMKYGLRTTSSELLIWDVDASRSGINEPLEEVISKAEIIVGAVPSKALRDVAIKVRDNRKDDVFFLSLTKGIDPETAQFPFETLDEVLSNYFGILSGPMIAEEIMAERPAAAVLATPTHNEKAQELFIGSSIHLRESTDVAGVSVLSVLKNVYSILLGVVDALELGANMRGILFTRILEEMKDILPEFGGDESTVYSLAGLGDLVATGTSEYSSNRRMGIDIVSKGTCSLDSEGCVSLPLLEKRLDISRHALLRASSRIVQEPQEAKSIILSLI